MSKRSRKNTPAGGVAVLDRPAAMAAGVDKALTEIGEAFKTGTRDKAVARLARLARLAPKKDAVVTAPSVVKVVTDVLKKATAKVEPVIATKAVAGGMIATSYRRTSGAMKGSYGALLQIPAMKGTLKGRWCRHPHTSAGEAITCAKAVAEAKVTVAA